MINSAKRDGSIQSLYSSEHKRYNSARDLPSGTILLESVKTLELDLQKRELIGGSGSPETHPLWFLAETERNVFLWRKGFSLIDVAKFEFWVDVDALISKRLDQIERFDPENPFFNSLWGFAACSAQTLDLEKEYLHDFQKVIASIISHAAALSAVTSIISRELTSCGTREIVVLPHNRSLSF